MDSSATDESSWLREVTLCISMMCLIIEALSWIYRVGNNVQEISEHSLRKKEREKLYQKIKIEK